MREAGPEDERSFSERLFGSRYRLELLAAFAAAPDGRVNLGVLAEGKGVRAAVYYPAIRDLLAMRLGGPHRTGHTGPAALVRAVWRRFPLGELRRRDRRSPAAFRADRGGRHRPPGQAREGEGMRGAAEVCPETVSEAASVFSAGIGSGAQSRVVLQGVPAVFSYRLEAEAGRRRRAGLGAITSPDILQFLLGLPVGVPGPAGRADPARAFRAALGCRWSAAGGRPVCDQARRASCSGGLGDGARPGVAPGTGARWPFRAVLLAGDGVAQATPRP